MDFGLANSWSPDAGNGAIQIHAAQAHAAGVTDEQRKMTNEADGTVGPRRANSTSENVADF